MKNLLLLITLLIAIHSGAQDPIKIITFTSSGNQDWQKETRANLTYYNNGDSVDIYTQIYLDSNWQNFHHEYKIYNNQKVLIRSFESHWEGLDNFTGIYKNETKSTIEFGYANGINFKAHTTKFKWYEDIMAWDTSEYTYAKIGLNGQQQISVLSEIVQLKFKGSPKQNIRKTAFGTDPLGKRTSEIESKWENESWVKNTSTSIQYHFQTDDIATRTTRTYTNGTFPTIPVYKREYKYISTGYLDSITTHTYDTTKGDYNLSSLEVYSYNEQGFLASKTIKIFDKNSGTWQNSYRTEYLYASTVAVDKEKQNLQVSIYPNPASNNLTVATKAPHSLKILTLEGKQVIENSHLSNHSSTSLVMLSSGIYFAEVKLVSGEIIRRKIIKE